MASSTHRLSIICVNDVYSFDDSDTHGPPMGGWSRAATLMKRLKQKYEEDSSSHPRTVLITANGDLLGGSSLLQHSHGKVAVEVMNSIPVDIAVLGNHEFDYGDDILMERIGESDCTWLGSNVYYSNSDGKPGYFPGVEGNGVIYTLQGSLKLGVFGLCTKQTPKISYPSANVTFDEDVLAVAQKICKQLRERGAQVIVAITHMSEAEDIILAKDKEASIDLILGGHEHEPLSVMLHRGEDDASQSDSAVAKDQKINQGGVLLFKCGMNANYVGTVDLDIEYENLPIDTSTESEYNITINTISTSFAMNSVCSRVPHDPAISNIVQVHRRKTEESMLIASFGKDIAAQLKLDDVLATIEKTSFSSSLRLDTRMSSVRRREATGGNMVADAMRWMLMTNIDVDQSGISMAMINGGFIRADRLYQTGSDFTVRHLLKELPFPRGMVVLKLKGKHLKDGLRQQLVGSSRGPTGSYPHLSYNCRLEYEISSSDSEDEIITIHSLKVDGSEVSDDHQYLIAVTGFVADGSEGCTSWLQSIRIETGAWNNIMMSCVLLKYLEHNPVIIPRLEGRVERIVANH